MVGSSSTYIPKKKHVCWKGFRVSEAVIVAAFATIPAISRIAW